MSKEMALKSDLLREWFRQRRITAALLDLDDTLADTHRLFRDQMRLFARYVSFHTSVDFPLLWSDIKEANNNVFQKHKVNPARWDAIIQQLTDLYSFCPAIIFEEGSDLLKQVYRLVPEFHPGAEETLAVFQSLGMKIGIITHANATWTRLKYEGLGLARFLPWERVHIVNEDKFKEGRDWQEAVQRLGVSPRTVLAVGDNVRGDMVASFEAEIAYRAYLPGEWSVYGQGELPPGTITVPGGIGKLVETLIAN
jgi:phosphoglycolate phosphatase-like HAD superfamily hydrolase